MTGTDPETARSEAATMYDYDDPDQTLSDACEEYLFEVLTDCPDDQICCVLDRVDQAKREEIIRKVRDALAFYETGPAFVPTDRALQVLKFLASLKKTLLQSDIAEQIIPRISRKTIGNILKRLKEVEAILYPEGERQGVVITNRGRTLLAEATTTKATATRFPLTTH